MSDNQANPTKGAETDLQKAAKSISGLLTPLNPKEDEEIGTASFFVPLQDDTLP